MRTPPSRQRDIPAQPARAAPIPNNRLASLRYGMAYTRGAAQAEAAVSVAEAVHRKVQPLPCRAADRPAHTKQASNSTGAATA